MEYTVLLFALIAVLAGPFVWWIHRRRARWRRPQLAIALVSGGVAVLVFGLSGAYGYFYPYGHPGAEMPGWRAMGDACWAAYAHARTASDTAAADSIRPAADGRDPSYLSCGTMRRNHVLGCRPGTRCGRLKARLRLLGD